jgi:hypothetical protein
MAAGAFRDPTGHGHLSNFGTYDPWERLSLERFASVEPKAK